MTFSNVLEPALTCSAIIATFGSWSAIFESFSAASARAASFFSSWTSDFSSRKELNSRASARAAVASWQAQLQLQTLEREIPARKNLQEQRAHAIQDEIRAIQ